MSSSYAAPGVSNRLLLHRLNGHLLTALQTALPYGDMRWDEWILNVIVLHRTTGEAQSVTLETSATMFFEERYFEPADCGLGKDVTSLDAPVPLEGSFAGYCITTGNIIWVDDLKNLRLNDPLKRVYRDFGYVGVSAPLRLPDAEYVFPLRARLGLSEALLGVLNCEWYKPSSPDGAARPCPFSTLGRNNVTDSVLRLMDLHGIVLPLAFEPQIADKGVDDPANVQLIGFHKAALDTCAGSTQHSFRSYSGTGNAE